MLQRVLEPEVMDTEQDAAEYDAIDHAEVNRSFVAEALSLCPNPRRVLDLGTGPAHIPIELVRLAPQAHVVGVDLAEQMLALARRNVTAADLRERIQLEQRDVKHTGFEPGTFDLIVCNSLVHHMPDPVALLREVARLAASSVALLIKDLLRPDTEAAVARLVELHAQYDSPYQQHLFAESLRAALTLEEAEAACAAAGLADVQIQRTSDRHYSITRSASIDA